MATRMQQRRGTAAQWTTANPVLAAGEIGFETDTNKFKMGNGTSAWTALTYFANAAELAAIIDGAPGTLDTLNELAAAINDDPAFFTSIATNLSSHASDTQEVHGIEDTALLATHAFVANAIAGVTGDYTTMAGAGLEWDPVNEQFNVDGSIATSTDLTNHHNDTLEVHGIADTSVLATTTDVNNAISDAAVDAADKVSVHNSDTTNVHGIADTADLALTADVNSALALKQDKITGVDDTEIGYLNGVTSGIQAQLDGKAASSHIHAQSDITDLTTDLAAKAPLASPTFTGTVTAAAVTITGDLTVSGTTTTVSAQDLVVSDPLIYIGEGNTANLVDLGLVSSFDDGTYQHAGIVRDASASKWKIFKGVTDEPTTTINFAQGSLDDLAVNNVEVAGVVFSDGTQAKEGVPSRTPIVQKTASYTLSALSERDSLIEVSSASATTITIPLNSAVAYPVGTSIDILQTSTGQVTIAGAAGVTVNATPGLKLRTTWSSATLFKRATDTWVVFGDLSA